MMRPHHRTLRWLALLLLWTFNAQLATTFAQLTFTTNTYYVGTTKPQSVPQSVAVADVNGDGKLDLISANVRFPPPPDYAGTLTVLTNNGSGGFTQSAELNVDVYPSCVVAADINGDGKPDLICAHKTAPGTLSVLTNNGSGGFGFNATLNVGNGPSCVVAADVNGDGYVDLVSANHDNSTLTVLTNNGSGGFGFNATLNVVIAPSCVVAADVNGDGKLDLVSSANGSPSSTLTVLTNNGSGGFGSNATLHVDSYSYWVVAADVNGDGKLDLVSANHDNDTLTVLTNNGSGGFGSNATLNAVYGPGCVVAADLNGDGKSDLICANVTGSLTVLINTTVFPPPSLNIALAGEQVALSWPAWATHYNFLETTTNLSAPNWVMVTGSAFVTNGASVGVTLTNAWPAAFFRLAP